MKIDIFCHIFPDKLTEALIKIAPSLATHRQIQQNKPQTALYDMEFRVRMLEQYGDVTQVLTIAEAPLYAIPNKKDVIELTQIANDEMAAILAKYPKHFIAGVAMLPFVDIESDLKELDRTIKVLGFKGIQMTTNIEGKPLDLPEFFPLYERMEEYDLPIWIHPHRDNGMPDYKTEKISKYGIHGVFGWPYETCVAMTRLMFGGVLDKFPKLRFITHHMGGGMVPFFEQRIVSWYDLTEQDLKAEKGFVQGLKKRPIEYFRSMFYNDTALYGSVPALMCGHAFFGADHIVFGTDMPFDVELGEEGIRETIRSIEQMDIPAEEKSAMGRWRKKP